MQQYKDLRASILLHETDLYAAEKIMREGNLRPSRSGYIGPGVYFAENKQATFKKAKEHGCYVVSAVNLGKLLEIYHPDTTLTQDKVKQMGFDSVRGYKSNAPDAERFNSGTEYCVFDNKRITPLFAQIDNNHNIYYLFNTSKGVVRINDIPVDRLIIILTENQITVGDNNNNIFSTLNRNEPLLRGLKLIFTNDGDFEFTKVAQKL